MEQSGQREEGENACLGFKMTHARLSPRLSQCIIKFRISGVNRNLVILGMLFQSPGLKQHNYVPLLLFGKDEQHLRRRTMKLQLRFRLAKAVFSRLL